MSCTLSSLCRVCLMIASKRHMNFSRDRTGFHCSRHNKFWYNIFTFLKYKKNTVLYNITSNNDVFEHDPTGCRGCVLSKQ